jgi:hypothetical protein
MKISCTPVPDSGFPNSEFRMAYGRSGIPHHVLTAPRIAGAGAGGGGCNGVGHGVSYLGVLCKQRGRTLDVPGGYLVGL